MDMVRRAFLQAIKVIPPGSDVNGLKGAMVLTMVRWIKLRVYPKRDWPAEFGPYPKELEAEVKE